MRMARSYSPRRRNRLPSAKCSSTVSGSTLTTSMNASIALSGCSLSRKLRPLKYEFGRARDSDTICLMSMRAAIHPSPKKSGKPSSHQYSNSMARWGEAWAGALPRPDFFFQDGNLPALAQDRRQQGQHAEQHAAGEEAEQHQDQRGLHGEVEIEAQRHRVDVLG